MRNWESFVLLLVDVQNDFWDESTAEHHSHFTENVTRLLAFCRSEGIEIVHLRAGFKADKSDWMAKYKSGDWIPCVENTEGIDVLPCAVAHSDEHIFVKQTFDGFQNPNLAAYLKASNKQFVLVAGLITSVCVLLTAASAAQRGYLTAVVEDCCADRSAMHDHVLDNYPFIFERVLVNGLAERHAAWQTALHQLASA